MNSWNRVKLEPIEKGQVMSKIILDFIKSVGTDRGFGYFFEKPDAVEYTREISKNQRNKYIR